MQKKLFVVVLRYCVELDQLDQYLLNHRRYLEQGYNCGLLLASGPQQPRTGGVIMAMAADRQEVWYFIHNDPFYIHHCAEYNVYEFSPIKYADCFKPIVDKLNDER